MYEATIILPFGEFDGYQAEFETELIDAFGGFTRDECKGGWRAPNGETILEPVSRYTVAGYDLPTNNGNLATLAFSYGQKLNQQAVYIRYFDGQVEILDTH